MTSTDTATPDRDRYQPALLVGLGGTGMRTLRFVRWIARNGGDKALEEALDAGRIKLIGFDTDDDANAMVEVDSHVLPRPPEWNGEWSSQSRTLPSLGGDFHLIPTRNIGNTLSILQRSQHERDQQVKDGGYWSYYDWLPKGDHQILQSLDSGQSGTKGASQWRPLGRMALCSDVQKIVDVLAAAARRVEFHLPSGSEAAGNLRIHLVCSLSGGTGAGMFWDIAFLLREQFPNCLISGSFLLADSFVGAVNTHRVQANCYAALKELAAYKNWRLKAGEKLHMRYQMDLGTRTLERAAGDHSDFETIYLYRSFKPANIPSQGLNVTRTLVDTNCLRIAESLIARQRNDMRQALDGNGRNSATDKDALRFEREREYIFSTSTTIRLDMGSPEQAAFGIRAALYRRLHDRTGGHLTPMLTRRSLIQALGDSLPSQVDQRIDGNEDLAAIWINGIVAANGAILEESKARWKAMLADIPAEANRIQAGDYSIANSASDALNAPPKLRSEAVCTLYERIDSKLRAEWRNTLTDANSSENQKDFPLGVLVLQDVEKHWMKLTVRLEQVREEMEKSLRLLDSGVRNWIEDSLSQLQPKDGKAEPPATATAASQMGVGKIPISIYHMRAELGLCPVVKVAELRDALATWQGGPVDVMFKRLCDDLTQAVSALKPRREDWAALVRQFVLEHRQALASALKDILDTDDNNHRTLSSANSQLNVVARDSVQMVHLDPDHAYEQTYLALLPIHNELARLRAETNRFRSQFDATGEALTTLAGKLENGKGEAGDLIGSLRDNDAYRKWSEFLKQLADRLSEMPAQPLLPQDPGESVAKRFMTVLTDLFEEIFLRSMDADIIRDERTFKDVLKAVAVLSNIFALHWLEQPAFLIQRLGGEAGIRDMIRRCHSTVFANSTAVKSIQLPRLVIALPAAASTLSLHKATASLKKLQDTFTTATRSVLQLEPVFTATPSDTPLIYLEDLYHPGRSIDGIEHLEHHYGRVDARIRPLLHFHRGADNLPPLAPARGSRAAMLCGNPECSYDITGLADDKLFCPGCHGPILNRCGNPGCGANDLAARLGPPGADRNDHPLPFHCPECNQRLVTHWWRCGEPGHEKERQSTRDGVCRYCMEEYGIGRRPYLEIRRFNPQAPFDCPGCLAQDVIEPAKRRKVPSELHLMFRDGLLPEHAIDFRSAARAAKLPIGECWQPDGKEHMLFPTLEYQSNTMTATRQLFREGKRFVSDDRRISTAYGCFHCGHPIHVPGLADTAVVKPTECPRCLRQVQECVYCTHGDHRLFAPWTAKDGTERCPRCDNLMAGALVDFNKAALNGLTEAAQCRNLLTCRAGARPWSTATELHHEHCACCSHDGLEIPLIGSDEFKAAIERCPHCLSLVGDENGPRDPDGRIIPLDAGAILDRFAERSAHDLRAPCPVCSAIPIVVLKWMVESEYFANLPTNDYEKKRQELAGKVADISDAIPQIDVKQGLDILNTIRGTTDTRLLRRKLTDITGRNVTLLDIQQKLDGLYTQQSPCQRALAQCLK